MVKPFLGTGDAAQTYRKIPQMPPEERSIIPFVTFTASKGILPMMTSGKWMILLPLFAATVGCGTRELTRAKAKKVLQESPQLQQITKPVGFSGQRDATCFRMAELINASVGSFGGIQLDSTASAEVLPKGRALIDKATYSIGYNGPFLRTWFKKPPLFVVDEITGITGTPNGNPNIKRVDFTAHFDWKDTGIGPFLVACFGGGKPQPAQRQLSLYDDGWRLDLSNEQ